MQMQGTPPKTEVVLSSQNVAVVGLGYVGLPLALLSRSKGHTVSGIDISSQRRELIAQASVPDLEDFQTASLKKEPLQTSNNYSAVATADIIIICVPTPVDADHNPDLTPVTSSCEAVGVHL